MQLITALKSAFWHINDYEHFRDRPKKNALPQTSTNTYRHETHACVASHPIIEAPLLPAVTAEYYRLLSPRLLASPALDLRASPKLSRSRHPVPFLCYGGFVKANSRANPVALRAVFDSFSNSISGSNAVSPITAERNMDLFLTKRARGRATVTGELAKKLNGGKTLYLHSLNSDRPRRRVKAKATTRWKQWRNSEINRRTLIEAERMKHMPALPPTLLLRPPSCPPLPPNITASSLPLWFSTLPPFAIFPTPLNVEHRQHHDCSALFIPILGSIVSIVYLATLSATLLARVHSDPLAVFRSLGYVCSLHVPREASIMMTKSP